ncbi:branched-chain amino acid ABC transporter permease [Bradyrhizobium sp. LHD-71]|uniref:branched-chain amino acid ABC transporter permease n=1 Tax=Bradyrhizobium sp. LHD-71 TaxID=3072141 RepID=UPI00280F6FC9|nr:branched-chain amino acid ABC transporter permease [Bradyrhizobium sp. LHD-71]MDQ8729216.1 branched-chain amino acid ABC transporter permease [Bradyrhizobium sp. LHD-71]
MTDPIVLLQIFWTGAATSSILVLLTVAFSLTQKVTGLWNFAQAGFMGIAFYAMFYVLNDLQMPLLVALAAGAVCAASASVLTEVFGLDVLRARKSGSLMFFIFTLILAQFIIYVLTLLFGTEPQTLYKSIMSPVRIIGGIAISNWDLQAVTTAVVMVTLLFLFLKATKEGQFLVAVSDNAKLAELYGISAKRTYRVTAAIAGLFICAAMYLSGTRGGVTPNSPFELVLAATIATLLGGMGRVFAGALAAVVLALIQSFSVLVISSRWQNLLLYGFLFVTITLFPRGITLARLKFKAAASPPVSVGKPADVTQAS